MKQSILSLGAAAVLASATLCGPALMGQQIVQSTTTTTSGGTVADFGPGAIVVRTDNATQPVTYTYRQSTVYVDENGNPVSMDVVKSGALVTVYYQKEGDDLVASKVVVRQTVPETQTAPAPPVAPPAQVNQTTTTTTTTNK